MTYAILGKCAFVLSAGGNGADGETLKSNKRICVMEKCDDGETTRDGYSGLEIYMGQIGNPLTRDENRRLFEEMAGETDEARKSEIRSRVITGNLRYVVKIVMDKYRGIGNMMDNIQCGNRGLEKAVDKYQVDRSRGCEFLPFAYRYICTEINRGSLDKMHVVSQGNRVNQKMRGRPANVTMVFLDEKDSGENGEPGDAGYLDRVVGGTDGGHRAMLDRMDFDYVKELLGRLKDEERQAVCLSYGIGVPDRLTYVDIGRRLGITKQRAQQVVCQAVEKMKAAAEKA